MLKFFATLALSLALVGLASAEKYETPEWSADIPFPPSIKMQIPEASAAIARGATWIWNGKAGRVRIEYAEVTPTLLKNYENSDASLALSWLSKAWATLGADDTRWQVLDAEPLIVESHFKTEATGDKELARVHVIVSGKQIWTIQVYCRTQEGLSKWDRLFDTFKPIIKPRGDRV